MTNVVEANGFGAGHQLAKILNHVFAGNRIHATVNELQRHGCLLQRSNPTFAVFAALGNVVHQCMADAMPVVNSNQAPEFIKLLFARLRMRAEDSKKILTKALPVHQPADEKAEWTATQALDRQQAVLFRKQPAV